MSDDPKNWRDTTSDASVAGGLTLLESAPLLVAPTFADEANTFRDRMIVVACWRIDDIRFEFASSFIRPEVANEFAQLDNLRDEHRGAPLSIFGHADPVGLDPDNKGLSGRRALAVQGVILRDTSIWESLYNNPSDRWGNASIQIMLNALGYMPGRTDGTMDVASQTAFRNFQQDKGVGPPGTNNAATRAALFQAYMNHICRDRNGGQFQLTKADFLARGADARGKGDVQGCSEFNPVLVFSQAEQQAYDNAADKTARNADNAPNRRVVVFLFRPNTRVDPTVWPCPRVDESIAGCKARFWSDGETRRKPQALRRRVEDTDNTYACRFYHRIADQSPCEFGDVTSIATIRYLNSTNNVIPIQQSFQVSNFVTTDQLPVVAATTFITTSTDTENFRIEVEDATAVAPVRATVVVRRGGNNVVGPLTYTLMQGAGADARKWRSLFFRLVTDSDDDAASGAGAASDPDNQTFIVRLGDTVRARFTPAAGPAARVELQVGRPVTENDNGANSLLHDIREVRVNVVVFARPAGAGGAPAGPARTRAAVNADLAVVDERLAQSAIRLNVLNINIGGAGDPGVALPPALAGGFTESSGGLIAALNPQEVAVVALKDANPNTVDIFYVDTITTVPTATSYPRIRNTTGNASAQNFVVTSRGANVFTLAHELMHILLNSPHRPNEPGTSLFRGGTTPSKIVGGTKRIGPYPQAAAVGVGNADTTTIRNAAETLP